MTTGNGHDPMTAQTTAARWIQSSKVAMSVQVRMRDGQHDERSLTVIAASPELDVERPGKALVVVGGHLRLDQHEAERRADLLRHNEILNVVQNGDRDDNVQWGIPIDVEMKFHSARTTLGVMRTDIRHEDVSRAKVRPARSGTKKAP
jgi:hypothetical protein